MDRLNQERRRKGISQQRLALLTGIPRSRIQAYEGNYAAVSPEDKALINKAIKNYKGEDKKC